MTHLNNEGTLDIFRRHEGGPIWVRAVQGREEALRWVAKLKAEQPMHQFLVWNSRTRQFVELSASLDALDGATNK